MRDICTTAQRRADLQVHGVVEAAIPVFNVDPNSAAWAADPDTLFERCDESQAQQKHHAAPDLLMHHLLLDVNGHSAARCRMLAGWLKDGWHPLRL
ncbi:uncharacterized protein PAN0_004c2451 [Moesziomyces antarcticus]|uniref:Uncharacterized protein n=1 Tax=Pseudozyma antarctica TaxID=84753 RepID=A0A081CC45_PSEA2|nr:uncharacterized protein PAN0_004c2451 [Moesziomyces antarcticus]GAK64241.1 hypothetical protein PAN0_004c2451 [Moesziomyces antarcticus]